MLDLSAMAEYLPEFVEGFIITAQVSIISIMGSFIIGLMVALARVSTNKIFNFISSQGIVQITLELLMTQF
jgi:ABC-type amino acid transport system permease subunit